MALQLQDLMMRLQPGPSMPSFAGGDTSQLEMEKQRLALMQQEFENTKQHQQQELALQQAAASARMAHEKAQQDRLLAEEQAKRDAEKKKQQQEVLGKFTELNGKGQLQEARAMLPLLNAAGLDVSLEGEDNGLPRYRIGPDPEAAARAQGDIGYPTDDSGTMAPPVSDAPATREVNTEAERQALTDPNSGATLSPTEPFFRQALAASAQSDATGRPARRPDAPDTSGSVPKNVIDTGALHAETLARLHPALNSLVAAYPSEMQGAMSNVADSVEQLGLPADKSMEVLDRLSPSGGPLGQAREDTKQAFEERKQGFTEQLDTRKQGFTEQLDTRKQDFEEQKAAAEAREKADALAMQGQQQASANYKQGTELGEKLANTYKVGDYLERRRQIGLATFALNNKDDSDDYMVGALISRMMGERGATTEPDIERALGDASMSFLERMKKFAFKEAIGGLSDPQKHAIAGLLKDASKEDELRAHDFLSNLDEAIDDPSTHPDVARGLRQYRNLVLPKDVRDKYAAKKPPAGTTAAAGTPPAFNMAADAQPPAEPEGSGVLVNDPRDWKSQAASVASQAGLDPKAFQGVIGVESGGNPAAQNPSGATGLIQFMPDIAQGLGTTTDAIAKMPVAEQLPLVVKYLKERGINEKSTQDDMYVAIAAGGFVGRPDSAVVYPVGSKGWKANPAWRPADGGDITVGDLKAYGGGRGKRPAAAASAAAPGGTSLAQRMRELRERYAQ